MEKLLLLSNNVHIKSVPELFVQPPQKRPNLIQKFKICPVIDLGELDKNRKALGEDLVELDKNRKALGEEILKASKEFGFFQVVNHGCQEKIAQDMMNVAVEFFKMPIEDKMELYSEDPKKVSKVHMRYDNVVAQFWRDSLTHPVNPVENFRHLWPSKPAHYKDVAEAYSNATRSLSLSILELLSEEMGLKPDYFNNDLTQTQLLTVNHYPPCPDPNLTLGMPKHCDPNLITVIQQGDVAGLQVFDDLGEGTVMEPLPGAFIIILGRQMQFITNGSLKSVEHQVVTNSLATRTTICTFISPSPDCTVEPAKELVGELNPQKYKAFTYGEFLKVHMNTLNDNNSAFETFKL